MRVRRPHRVVSSSCANRECGIPFSIRARSTNDVRYCENCADLVWAFRPNSDKPTEWFHISPDDLREGVTVEGDQCEGCGLSAYTVRRRSTRLWVAVCEGQEWDQEMIPGCRMEHPVRQKPAMSVIF
jgi:hypothetical protein